MKANAKRNSTSGNLPYSSALAVSVVGVVIGVGLAALAVFLIRDFCGSAPACQRQMSALVGGFALMQALHIAIIYLLIDRLIRQSERRALDALLQRLDDVKGAG